MHDHSKNGNSNRGNNNRHSIYSIHAMLLMPGSNKDHPSTMSRGHQSQTQLIPSPTQP